MKKLALLFLLISYATLGQEQGQESKNSIDYDVSARATIDLNKDRQLIERHYQNVRKYNNIESSQTGNVVGSDKSLTLKSTSYLLETYQGEQTTKIAIRGFASNVVKFFVGWFGAALFLLSLFNNYWSNVVKGKNVFDFKKLARDVVLYAVLLCYVPIMGGLNWALDGVPFLMMNVIERSVSENKIAQFTLLASNPEWGLSASERNNVIKEAAKSGNDELRYIAVLLAMEEKIKTAEKNTRASDKEGFFSLGKSVDRMIRHLETLPVNLIIGALNFLSIIVKFVVILLVISLDAVLFVAGPLAILFSYVGIFKDKWITWLSSFMMVKCILATIVIVDGVMLLIMNTGLITAEFGTSGHAAPVLSAGFALTSIICYCLTPWLTSRWIGSEETGKFLSVAAAGAAKMAAAATGFSFAGAAGGGSASGGSSVMDSLGNMGKNMKDDPDNNNK